MTDMLSRTTNTSVGNIDDVEEDDVDRNVKQAVRDAIRKHKENGNPIAVWEDGKVKIIPPEDIVLPPLSEP